MEETPADIFEKMFLDVWRIGLLSVGIETVQVNVGLQCNQSCTHYHLECSPARWHGNSAAQASFTVSVSTAASSPPSAPPA